MMKCKLLDSEHERTKLQEQLEDAYVRLEKGLAPTIEAQAEWKRYLDKQVDKEIQQQRVTELTEGKGPLFSFIRDNRHSRCDFYILIITMFSAFFVRIKV